MKMVKRWGVMALVALLVLGTMGAALADDTVETETETAKEPLEKDAYEPDALVWAGGLVQFVFYWGYLETGDPPPCEEPKGLGTTSFLPQGPVAAADPALCVPLNVASS